MQKVNSKKISEEIYNTIKNELSRLDNQTKLVIIEAGNDDASKKYISLKLQKALELGIKTDLIRFNEDVSIDEILKRISELNLDTNVNGILIQLPLFNHLLPYKHRILNSINPLKDVDGLSAINFGLYSQDIMNGILPATVDACLEVIKDSFNKNLQGSNVLIINNSDLIGKPLSMVLTTLGATVIITNEFTDKINDYLNNADIIISATGKGNLYSYSQAKEDSLVIDVTSIKKEDQVIGDFKKEEIDKNITVTPVPGGIGPLTIACLFRNLVNLTKLQKNG